MTRNNIMSTHNQQSTHSVLVSQELRTGMLHVSDSKKLPRNVRVIDAVHVSGATISDELSETVAATANAFSQQAAALQQNVGTTQTHANVEIRFSNFNATQLQGMLKALNDAVTVDNIATPSVGAGMKEARVQTAAMQWILNCCS